MILIVISISKSRRIREVIRNRSKRINIISMMNQVMRRKKKSKEVRIDHIERIHNQLFNNKFYLIKE